MNVEANEDFRDSSNDKKQQIVKGKRTKRQTPSSPFGVAVTDTSSPSSGGERPEEVSGGGCRTFLSPATTSSEMSTTTEEDEDMANCLILLAQNCRAKAKMEKEAKVKKVTITKSAAAADTTGKVAEVYECRTCNRSFPSFQALGGHRASHKKLKIMPEEKTISLGDVERKVSERQTQEEGLLHKIVSVEKVSCSNNKGNKMHKCSICGSEFSSGQALGGHMRRHRTSSGSTHRMNNTVQSSVLDHTRNILPFDLNLPAPEEEGEGHQLDSEEFQLIKTNQKQHLYFSYPAVVDCHY